MDLLCVYSKTTIFHFIFEKYATDLEYAALRNINSALKRRILSLLRAGMMVGGQKKKDWLHNWLAIWCKNEHCVCTLCSKSNDLKDLMELVCKRWCGLTGIHRQTMGIIKDYYGQGVRRPQLYSCFRTIGVQITACRSPPVHLRSFVSNWSKNLWPSREREATTRRELERRKRAFLVSRRPGLREADTSALIINALLWLLVWFCLYTLPLSRFPPSRPTFLLALLGQDFLSIVWDKGSLWSLRGVAVTLLILYLYTPKPETNATQQRSTISLISMCKDFHARLKALI